MISLEKLCILTPLQKMPKNVGDFCNIIVATGFKKLPKVQKIAQSGHTAWEPEPPVWPDWAILESSWKQIFLQKLENADADHQLA